MSRRSMLPREHGAYFQLALPLVAAGFSHAPGGAGVALLAASCLAFLAHEPLLILVGARGARLRSTEAPRARRWFAWLAGGAGALGALGLALAPAAAAVIAAIAAATGAVLIVLAKRRIEHTLAGELVAAVALTGASGVVLAASGAAIDVVTLRWLGWALGFSATVIAVHHVLARHKRAASAIDRLLALGFTAASIALVATAGRCATSAIAAPLVLVATVVVIAPPRATRLRAVGIAIAATAAVSAVLGVAIA